MGNALARPRSDRPISDVLLLGPLRPEPLGVIWLARRFQGRFRPADKSKEAARPAPAETRELLEVLARDNFAAIRRNPPLMFHNDLTAKCGRFYWSEDFGYALWLRLY